MLEFATVRVDPERSFPRRNGILEADVHRYGNKNPLRPLGRKTAKVRMPDERRRSLSSKCGGRPSKILSGATATVITLTVDTHARPAARSLVDGLMQIELLGAGALVALMSDGG
jgi:hypothetical protein